jgi:hypothetical protein
MISAEKKIAMMGLGGIPSERRGMSELPTAALFAYSGPATPAIAPLPNFSGCLETFFSTA